MPPENQTRRDFLKKTTLAAAGSVLALVAKVWSSRTTIETDPLEGETRKKGAHRWGMVIDLDRCTCCQACVVACTVENNALLGSPEDAALGRIIRWLKILPKTEAKGSRIQQTLIPLPCQQCENPPCTRVCPTSATYMSPDGIVGQVYDRCIGCRYCVNACPYTCKFFNWGDPRWPAEVETPMNPDVSVRYKGVVEKCLFCHHRLQRAHDKVRKENRALREGDYIPACAQACPAKAIVFGDLDDPESEVFKLSTSRRAFVQLEELGTHPKVIYLREG